MAQINMSDMLKAGLHFGHQTRRWNPKMKQFILTQRNGIHIINLFKSLELIDKAYDFIKATVAHNGTVLFVGYQGAGTLGRALGEGASKVRLLGEEIELRAQIR